MASKLKKLGTANSSIINFKNNYKVAIVVSEYYFDEINKKMLDACINKLIDKQHKKKLIYLCEYVPGAFEMTIGANLVYQKYKPDTVIVIGCVIKGQYRIMINTLIILYAQGITQLSVQYNIPFILVY